MRLTQIVSMFSIVLFVGATVKADIIKLDGVVDKTIENFTVITNPSLPMSGPTIINGAAYTGLYLAEDVTTGQQWNTFCIDPIGDIKIGDSWNANLLSSTDLAMGQGVLYAPSYNSDATSTVEKYSMISYIANKYYYTADQSITPAVRSDVSLAMWEISRDYSSAPGLGSLNLSSGNFQSTGGNSFTTSLLSDAYDHRDDAINMMVFSPTNRPSQEFLAISVPEPSSFGMLLMGLSLLSGIVFARRRTGHRK